MGIKRCEKHNCLLTECYEKHLPMKDPVEIETSVIEFNDGNNLTVLTLNLRLSKGRIYYKNKAGKWPLLDVRILERRNLIE